MQLDHLVYAVPDLNDGIRDFQVRLGAAPTAGGRHEAIGTHNAILPLRGDAYVELMAPDPENPDPPLGLPFGLADRPGPGLVTWAARTRDIEGAVASSRSAGFDPGNVADLSRETPDGRVLRWRLTLGGLSGDGVVPFLIDWGDTRHPSGSGDARCRIEGFRAEHPDPTPIRAALDALGCTLDVKRGPRACLLASVVGRAGRLELSGRPE